MLLGSNPELVVQTHYCLSSSGLAAGHITMLVFGDETRNYFLVIGQAVDDVRLAQNMAQMNDVILSPNCWQLCDRSMIEIERIPDQRAVKVRVWPLPSVCQRANSKESGIAKGHALWEEPGLLSSRRKVLSLLFPTLHLQPEATW